MVVMGRRLQEGRERFTYMVEQTNKIGLEMNVKNTKFITLSRKSYSENEYVKRSTYNFEIVKDYTHLGTILTHTNELRPEIEKELRMQIGHIMQFYV
jgi:hypothetical protein